MLSNARCRRSNLSDLKELSHAFHRRASGYFGGLSCLYSFLVSPSVIFWRMESNAQTLPSQGAILTVDGWNDRVEIQWAKIEGAITRGPKGPIEIGKTLTGQFSGNPFPKGHPKIARLELGGGRVYDIFLWRRGYFTSFMRTTLD